LKGERRPEGSLAAQPNAFLGCSISACDAISIRKRREDRGVFLLGTNEYLWRSEEAVARSAMVGLH